MADFGKLTDGGSSSTSTADRKQVSAFSPSTSGIVASLTARLWLSVAGTGNWRGLIYSDTAGVPDVLLAVTDDASFTSTTETAQTSNFTGGNKISVTAGVTYWIGWHHQDPGVMNFTWSRDSTASAAQQGTDTWSDGSSTPFGTPTALNGPVDVYVTYTDTVTLVVADMGSTPTLASPILTQILTIDGAGNTTSGWLAEGGDYLRLQSDDGDTSRLYSPTTGDVYQGSLTNTSGLTGKIINSVTVHAKVKSLDPVSNTIQIGVRTNSTDYYSANKDTNPNNTTYIDFTETWTTNPNTSIAWTISDLDALQIGLKKTNSAGIRWSYGYAEVDYSDGGTTLVVADMGTTPTLEAPILTQANTLVVQDSSSTPTLETFALSQAHTLTVASLSTTPTLDTVILTQQNTLAVAAISTTPTFEVPTLVQQNTLVVASIGSTPTLEVVVLSSAILLAVSDISTGTTLNNIGLAQAHIIIVNNLSSTPTMGAIVVTTTAGASGYQKIAKPTTSYGDISKNSVGYNYVNQEEII